MKKAFLYVPAWILLLLFRFVFIIIGFIVVPIAAILGAYQDKISPYYNKVIPLFTWKFMRPWSNLEDGEYAGEEFIGYPKWIRIVYWSCWRNPTAGLRWMKPFACKIDPSRVLSVGKYSLAFTVPLETREENPPLRYFCWMKGTIYANFRIEFSMFGSFWRFWIGHKIYPSDENGINENDYRYHGCGFATQFKRLKIKETWESQK